MRSRPGSAPCRSSCGPSTACGTSRRAQDVWAATVDEVSGEWLELARARMEAFARVTPRRVRRSEDLVGGVALPQKSRAGSAAPQARELRLALSRAPPPVIPADILEGKRVVEVRPSRRDQGGGRAASVVEGASRRRSSSRSATIEPTRRCSRRCRRRGFRCTWDRAPAWRPGRLPNPQGRPQVSGGAAGRRAPPRPGTPRRFTTVRLKPDTTAEKATEYGGSVRRSAETANAGSVRLQPEP